MLALYATFERFDRNKDGKIVAKEIVDAAKLDGNTLPMNHLAFLRALDVNKDGSITYVFWWECQQESRAGARTLVKLVDIATKAVKLNGISRFQ